MSRILILPGSLRRGAWSMQLALELADRLMGMVDVDVIEAESLSLPLFNEDLEEEPTTAARVMALHARFCSADGIILCTPEYNGQLPPVVTNMIDWVSRPAYRDASLANPFLDKPTLLCTVSTGGSGGALAIAHARALMGYVGAHVLGITLSIPHADSAWLAPGMLTDPTLDVRLEHALACLMRSLGLSQGTAALA